MPRQKQGPTTRRRERRLRGGSTRDSEPVYPEARGSLCARIGARGVSAAVGFWRGACAGATKPGSGASPRLAVRIRMGSLGDKRQSRRDQDNNQNGSRDVEWIKKWLIGATLAAGSFGGAPVLAPSPANDIVRDRQPYPRHDFSARSRLDGAPLIELDIIVARQGSGRKPRPDFWAFQGFDDGRRIIDLPRTVLIIVEAIHDPGNAHMGRYCLGIGDGLFVGMADLSGGRFVCPLNKIPDLASAKIEIRPMLSKALSRCDFVEPAVLLSS